MLPVRLLVSADLTDSHVNFLRSSLQLSYRITILNSLNDNKSHVNPYPPTISGHLLSHGMLRNNSVETASLFTYG
jgi:hypothetical protein